MEHGRIRMANAALTAALVSLMGAASLSAANIDGTIIVQRRLTKAKVTAAANTYSRGISVALRPDESKDVLAYERSHVVVYLEGSFPGKPAQASMEQKERRFYPDLLVLPAGSTVSFPNLDPIFHNVFSLSKPKEFDLGNYPKDQTRTVTFANAGIVFVNCHLHANMGAVIFITPNEWSTRPDGAGRFTLAGVPPGTYTIKAWHKAAGYFQQRVTVTESGATPVSFVIPLAADPVIASR